MEKEENTFAIVTIIFFVELDYLPKHCYKSWFLLIMRPCFTFPVILAILALGNSDASPKCPQIVPSVSTHHSYASRFGQRISTTGSLSFNVQSHLFRFRWNVTKKQRCFRPKVDKNIFIQPSNHYKLPSFLNYFTYPSKAAKTVVPHMKHTLSMLFRLPLFQVLPLRQHQQILTLYCTKKF